MRSGVICGRKSTNVSGGFRTSNERYVWVRWTSPDAGGARSWELSPNQHFGINGSNQGSAATRNTLGEARLLSRHLVCGDYPSTEAVQVQSMQWLSFRRGGRP